MSKKTGKQKHNRSTVKYVVIGVFGLALIAVAAFSFLGSKGNHGIVSEGAPAASVDQKMIDYGDLKDYAKITLSINVTNTGTGILNFNENPYIQVVEGCCPPELAVGKMSLRPGESTTVTSSEFFMHPGMDGKHNFAVHIKTNDPSQPDLVVNVLSNWSQ